MGKSLFWGLVLFFVMSSSCSYRESKNTNGTDGLATDPSLYTVVDVAKNEKAIAWLQTNCKSCHGDPSSAHGRLSSVDNVDKLISDGWIVPLRSQDSPLFQICQSGAMPPGRSVSASDLDFLADWIDTAFEVNSELPNSNPAPSGGAGLPEIVPPSDSTIKDPVLNQEAMTLLQNKCSSCHSSQSAGSGGFATVLDVDAMIADRMIYPGNPEASLLYKRIAEGSMPPGSPFSANEKDLIYRWIRDALVASPDAPEPIPLAANYTSINENILKPKCVSCHGADIAKEGRRYDSYTETMRSVRAGRPSDSKLYTITLEGEMPPRPRTSLTSQELAVIAEWIRAGAKND